MPFQTSHQTVRSCKSTPTPTTHLSDSSSRFSTTRSKLQSLQLRNVLFWPIGVFKGLRPLEFIHPPVSGHLPREPVARDPVHREFSILPDSKYAYIVAPQRNPRQLRATSDVVSICLHLINVPTTTNIGIVRSFCDVAGPGVNFFFYLHAGLPWIKFLDGTHYVTVSSMVILCPSR